MLTVQEYGNCSCVGDVGTNTSDVSSTAVEGVCDVTSCYTWRVVVFFVIFFVAMIVIFVCEIFHLCSMLRYYRSSIPIRFYPGHVITMFCLLVIRTD